MMSSFLVIVRANGENKSMIIVVSVVRGYVMSSVMR